MRQFKYSIQHDATAGKKLKIKLTHLSRCCGEDTGEKHWRKCLLIKLLKFSQASIVVTFCKKSCCILWLLLETHQRCYIISVLCTDITDIANLALCLVSLHSTAPQPSALLLYFHSIYLLQFLVGFLSFFFFFNK